MVNIMSAKHSRASSMAHLTSQEEYGATGAPYMQTSACRLFISPKVWLSRLWWTTPVILSLSLPPLTFTDLKTPKSSHKTLHELAHCLSIIMLVQNCFQHEKKLKMCFFFFLRKQIAGQLNCCWNLIAEMAGGDGL